MTTWMDATDVSGKVKTCLVIWVKVFVLTKESYSGDILRTALNKYKTVHD